MVAKFGASVIYENNYRNKKGNQRKVISFSANNESEKLHSGNTDEPSFIKKHWTKVLTAATTIGVGVFCFTKGKKTIPLQDSILDGYDRLISNYNAASHKKDTAFKAPELSFKKFSQDIELLEYNQNDNIIYINKTLLEPGQLVLGLQGDIPIKIATKKLLADNNTYSLLDLTNEEIVAKVLGNVSYFVERARQNQLIAKYVDLDTVAVAAAKKSNGLEIINKTDAQILEKLKQQYPYLFNTEIAKRTQGNDYIYQWKFPNKTMDVTIKQLVEDILNNANHLCDKMAKMTQSKTIERKIGTIWTTSSKAKEAMLNDFNPTKSH